MAAARGSLDQLANERPKFPEGLELILVDDNDDAHTVQQLSSLKYRVTKLSSVTAAVAALSSMSADLVLADVSLVGDPAGKAAKELFSAAGQIPVVWMGTKCTLAHKLCAVNHGAADFLEKPLSQLKLRNIWQHTVRMMMNSCHLKSTPSSPAAVASVEELMAKHDAAAAAAAASAASLEEQPCSISASGVDGHEHGLPQDAETPDFLPPQFNMDADTLLLGLEAPVRPDEANLDDILQPYAGADFLSADQLSTDQLLTNGSSEQHESGATGYGALPPELESCADTASGRQFRTQQPSTSAGTGAGLRYHASTRDCHAMSEDHTSPQPVKGTPCSHPQQQLHGFGCAMYPQVHPGTSWGAQTGVKGMVWGMPILNVARVPGLAVPAASGKGPSPDRCSLDSRINSAVASTTAIQACKGSAVSPVFHWPMTPFMMPPWSWLMMPMMGMFGGMQSVAMAGTQSPMLPWMCGMMGSWGTPMMAPPGMCAPGHTAGNATQGPWPAHTKALAGPTHTEQQAAAALADCASHPAPACKLTTAGVGAAAVRTSAACTEGPAASGQEPAVSALMDMYRAGSLASSDAAFEDEFVDQLFVEEPKYASTACR